MTDIEIINKERSIHPFYKESIDRIFTMPDKQLFAIDGSIGTGKTSEFTVRGAYTIACSVLPRKINGRMVRESKWAMIRTSENSAYSTLLGILQEAIFSPEIVATNKKLVTTTGQHPRQIHVNHDLGDGTFVHMICECHGFDNMMAEHRLKTHEFTGAMLPEVQGIKQNILETAIERCGRWRADTTVIERTIGEKKYRLSGISQLCIVLADINFPPRPHYLYDMWYDNPDKKNIPYYFFRPPQPIIPVPINKIDKEPSENWTRSVYLGEEVVWVPNPKAYKLTKHFEEKDENGNPIPWTGYKYWLSKVHQSDTRVTRYVVGKPDYSSGLTAIYSWQMNDENTKRMDLDSTKPVYIGYDPGGHSAFVFLQVLSGNHVHVFNEMVFDLNDNASNREQIEDFVIPYCAREFRHMDVIFIADPAFTFLGRSRMAANAESAMNVLKFAISDNMKKENGAIRYKIQRAKVSNTDLDTRINSLAYFINQNKFSVDPVCSMVIAGLLGGYHYKSTSGGTVSETVDKDDPSCDTIEALQYPLINILVNINKKTRTDFGFGGSGTPRQGSVSRRRRR